MNLEILIGAKAAQKIQKSGINILQACDIEIEYIAGPKAAKKIQAAKSLIMDIELPEQIKSSNNAYQYVKDMYQLDHEQFIVLALNRQNKVIDKITISQGGMCSTIVDFKILFRRLLIAGATGFIAVHNHPSGNLEPSQDDIKLTRRMIDAGLIIDIKCYDHLIVAGLNYYSFADNGII